jgi:sialate O-acetylesterase
MKSRILHKLSGLAVAALLCFNAHAGIKLPALIADNMVLQQNSNIILWGWANGNETIVINASWNKKAIKTIAKADGTWQISIKTPKAGGPYSIDFKATNDIVVNNVLIGEVWLASGQSNMEFYMGKAEGWRTGVENYETEIEKANYPNIRMIDVKNTVADSPLTNITGKWEICTPQAAADFSAVAYYFAVNLQKEKGFPVGIINSTWGCTPAESWTKKSVLENNPEFQPILDRYKADCAAYPEKYAVYKSKYEHWKADTSSHKKGAPKEPIGPNHSKSPYKLYNGMIAPLLNYKFRGVIWYQGESNVDYAYQYRKLFPAMIQNWRSDFHYSNMPFYFVQIAPHKSANPVLRESQLYTYEHIANTGIVITTDVGNATDIHPRNKKTVGDRLSYWALHQQYGSKSTQYSGPIYESMKLEGNKAVLKFKFADGLNSKDASLKGFTIAGKDQKFVDANAKIIGDNIEVWSDAIANPEAVRFGWQTVPDDNLFNAAGLPATPFRTDNWIVDTQEKK